MKQNLISPANEFSLQRMHNGITILEHTARNDENLGILRPLDLYSAPISVYFLDTEDNHLGVNIACTIMAGFNSENDALGNSVIKTMKRQSFLSLHYHNQHVLQTKTHFSENHTILMQDGRLTQVIDYKFPWYDSQGKILGIFGLGIECTHDNPIYPLKSSIEYLGKILFQIQSSANGALNYQYQIGNIALSKRESECVALLIKGMTAKMIAKKLGLSPRTIEHHIENLKFKFNVSTKFALVETIIKLLNF